MHAGANANATTTAHHALVDSHASFSRWAAPDQHRPTSAGSNTSPQPPPPDRGTRVGQGLAGVRSTSAAAPRAMYPLSDRGAARSATDTAAARPVTCEAMDLVAMKRAELDRAARELAELEALAATRRSTVEAMRPRSRGAAPARHASVPAPVDRRGAQVLVDAGADQRPRLPLHLQPREQLAVEPPKSATGVRTSGAALGGLTALVLAPPPNRSSTFP